MITQINNYQSNLSYHGAKIKSPKLVVQNFKKTVQKCDLKNKINDTFTKVKTEFKNMDEETKDLLFKVVVGYTILGTFVGVVIHCISVLMEKFNNLFQ